MCSSYHRATHLGWCDHDNLKLLNSRNLQLITCPSRSCTEFSFRTCRIRPSAISVLVQRYNLIMASRIWVKSVNCLTRMGNGSWFSTISLAVSTLYWTSSWREIQSPELNQPGIRKGKWLGAFARIPTGYNLQTSYFPFVWSIHVTAECRLVKIIGICRSSIMFFFCHQTRHQRTWKAMTCGPWFSPTSLP